MLDKNLTMGTYLYLIFCEHMEEEQLNVKPIKTSGFVVDAATNDCGSNIMMFCSFEMLSNSRKSIRKQNCDAFSSLFSIKNLKKKKKKSH